MPKEYLNGDLPDELMLEFPKYLDRKDLGHLCMTTPRLRSIVESLYFETVTVRLGRTVSSKDAHADIRGLAATLTKFTRHLLVDVPPQLRAQDLCQALFESMGVTSILSLTFTRSSSLESTASTAISNWFQKSSILSKITLPGSYVANGKKSGRPTAKFTGTLVFGNGSRYLTICFKGGRDGTDVKLLKGAALILGNNKSVEAMILLCKIQPCKIPTLLKGIGLDCSKPLQVPVLSLEGHYYDVLTEGDLNLFDMKSVRQVFLVGYSNPGSFLKRLASAAYSTSSLKEFHFADPNGIWKEENAADAQEGLINVLTSFHGLTEIVIRVETPLKLSAIDVIHHSELTKLIYRPGDLAIIPEDLDHIRLTCPKIEELEFRSDNLVDAIQAGKFTEQFLSSHALITDKLALFPVLRELTIHTELYANSVPRNNFVGFEPEMPVTQVLLEKTVDMILTNNTDTPLRRICICMNDKAKYDGLPPLDRAEVSLDSLMDWRSRVVFKKSR